MLWFRLGTDGAFTWDEVSSCRKPEQLTFSADEVVDRVADIGDLFVLVEQNRVPLPD